MYADNTIYFGEDVRTTNKPDSTRSEYTANTDGFKFEGCVNKNRAHTHKKQSLASRVSVVSVLNVMMLLSVALILATLV